MKTEMSYEAERLVRRGYFKMHKHALDEKGLSSLSAAEKDRYIAISKKIEDRIEFTKKVGYAFVILAVLVGGAIWWRNDSIRKIKDEIAEKTPTRFNSPEDHISAMFPNRPHELRDNPDAADSKSVTAHHEVISGNSGNSLYMIDIVYFKPRFDELDCMMFLGDTDEDKGKLKFRSIIKLNDGRPTLNYVRPIKDNSGTTYGRTAIVATRYTNICYRFVIAGNRVVAEKTFRNFLSSVRITEPAR